MGLGAGSAVLRAQVVEILQPAQSLIALLRQLINKLTCDRAMRAANVLPLTSSAQGSCRRCASRGLA